MLPPTTRRWSQALRLVSFAAMSAVLGALVYAVWDSDAMLGLTGRSLGLQPDGPVGAGGRILVWLGFALVAVALLFTLGQIARLFGLYAGGEAVTPGAARTISRIGVGLLAVWACQIVGPVLLSLGLTLDNAPGQRMVSVQLSSNAIALLLAAGLLLIVGIAMRQAAEMADELREIV